MATSTERETIYRLRKIHNLDYKLIYPLFPHIPKSSIRKIVTRESQKEHSPTNQDQDDNQPIQPEYNQTKIEHGPDGFSAETRSIRIITLDDLIERAQIDLQEWQIDHWIANAWEQGQKGPNNKPVILTLHQVKAFLKKNQRTQALLLLDDLKKDLEKLHGPKIIIPKWNPRKNKHASATMLEISIPDIHIGKFAWGELTGEPYNIEIAKNLFITAVKSLLESSDLDNVEQILFPTGNDLFHIDTPDKKTTKGTPQDTDGLIQQHFRIVRMMIAEAIELMLQVAPVALPIVPGNHDRYISFYLGEALFIQYENTKHVTIDNGPQDRKYYPYGVNLIGFTHYDKMLKTSILPQIMAHEAKQEWAKTSIYEWHTGHLHTKEETVYTAIKEIEGVRIRRIPSLSPADEWHYEKGYTMGLRSAESYLWSKESGMVATNYINVV